MKKLNEILDFTKPIIYIDIEATSNQKKLKILQLSAIVVENNKIIKTFDMWSNPNEYISDKVLNLLNKKRNFFLKQKPNKFLLREFIKFIDQNKQVVCFGNYDQRIMDYQYKTIKKKPIKLIDIQKDFFNKFISKNKISISLSSLADAFSISNTQSFQHDALLDTHMLYNVIKNSKEIESEKNLKKIISNELIKPRKKNYRKNSDLKISKEYHKLKKDSNISYYDLKINKKYIDHIEKKRYISSVNFLAKKYSHKGELIIEIEKQFFFKKNEQQNIEKNLEWFFKKFNDLFFKDSIIIYNKNFNLFLEYFKKKNGWLPIFYYIPNEYVSYYAKEILGSEKTNYIFDKETSQKLFLLIRQKSNNLAKKIEVK